MRSDQLIDRLAADLKPVRRRRPGIDAAIIGAVCLAELVLFFAFGMERKAMPAMMHSMSFWWRLASLGIIALVSGAAALRSLHPAESPRRAMRPLVGIVLICLLAGWFINTGFHGLHTLAARLDWHDGIQCASKIVLLSIAPIIGFGILMRRGAATDARATALLIGVAAAAWGAFVFVFACPFSDPLYIAVWYGIACGIVALFARIVLPRMTGW